jgi:hypothetical protein
MTTLSAADAAIAAIPTPSELTIARTCNRLIFGHLPGFRLSAFAPVEAGARRGIGVLLRAGAEHGKPCRRLS